MPLPNETMIEPSPTGRTGPPLAVNDTFDDLFATLFRERFSMLSRYLSRTTGDPALADDLAQESFVRLHARASMPNDPAAWLVSVAHNLLRDERRTTGRRRRLLARWHWLGDQTQRSPTSDARVLAEERETAVRRALTTLSIRDQRLLILRHEGFSYREIAEALDIALSSVGTLLARATAALSKAYRELPHASD